jgi:hemolysin activation/secretion protein
VIRPARTLHDLRVDQGLADCHSLIAHVPRRGTFHLVDHVLSPLYRSFVQAMLIVVVVLPARGQTAAAPATAAASATQASVSAPVVAPAKPVPRAEPRFDILAFSVSGNTVLSAGEIERTVYPFLGENKTIADAERARVALERAYQQRGFLSVAVQLPPQTAADNELSLLVVETQIGQRRITGAVYNLPSLIAAATPSLTPGTVPDFNELQADLARVQGKADLQVTPVLVAAQDPGKLDVELKVADQLALHGTIELNNKHTFNTDPGKVEAGLHYDNLFQRQHALGVNWLLPIHGTGRGSTWVFSHGAPLVDGRLSTTLVVSDSSTPTSLGGATVTQGETIGSRYRQPLGGAEPGFGHGWTVGGEFKNNRDGNHSVAGVSTQNPDLRYLVLQAGYDVFRSLSAGE